MKKVITYKIIKATDRCEQTKVLPTYWVKSEYQIGLLKIGFPAYLTLVNGKCEDELVTSNVISYEENAVNGLIIITTKNTIYTLQPVEDFNAEKAIAALAKEIQSFPIKKSSTEGFELEMEVGDTIYRMDIKNLNKFMAAVKAIEEGAKQ